MKKKCITLILCCLAAAGCRKHDSAPAPQTLENTGFTLESAKQSFKPDTVTHAAFDQAVFTANTNGGYWLVPLPGRPRFQQLALGYRELLFYKDEKKQISHQILEIIPDAHYLQRQQKVNKSDFTGRIFVYDEHYRLLKGQVFANGQIIGKISSRNDSAGNLHTNVAQTVTTCEWVDANYVNSDGEAVIYSENVCNSTTYDDGSDVFGGGSGGTGGTAPVGGGGSAAGTPPQPSNLPGESKSGINPKTFMDCFSTIPDNGATMKITVYVQEPWPGTTFNLGPNSVGHTAIGLTKTNGSQTITQVVGYYPDATGLSKMHAPSKVVNNGGDLEYNNSITYTLNANQFSQIAAYISTPPTTYDVMDFNCTNFVVEACSRGGISLPDPNNTVGLSGPGGASVSMTPAGLGNSIENLKGQSNVNTNGGTTPISKGPCN